MKVFFKLRNLHKQLIKFSVKKFLEITEKSLKWKPRIKKKLIMIFLNLP